MPENKEFEEYSKSYSSKTQSLYDTIGAVSKFLIPDLDRFRQESYEAGQQSEREKHRWIPVTERLPTKHDGETELYEAHNTVEVLIKRYIDGKYYYTVCLFFLDTNTFPLDCVVSWQPLPTGYIEKSEHYEVIK